MKYGMRWFGVLAIALGLNLATAPPAGAQTEADGWRKVPPRSGAAVPATASPWTVVAQIGHPGVLSPRVRLPLQSGRTVSVGPTLLPSMLALTADIRQPLIRPGGLGVSAGVGGGFFRLSEDGVSRSPLGGWVFLGLRPEASGAVTLEGEVGWMVFTGSDGGPRAYGLEQGTSSAYVNIGLGLRP